MGASMVFEVRVEITDTNDRGVTEQGIRSYVEDALRTCPALSGRIADLSVVPAGEATAGRVGPSPSKLAYGYNSTFAGFCFCAPSAAAFAIGNI